jgi:hypothetical protein
MAKKHRSPGETKKKTRQGNGKFSRFSQKGSQAATGGKTPKGYRKRYRGQGKK